MPVGEDEDPVGALATEGTDPPFGDGVRTGSADRRADAGLANGPVRGPSRKGYLTHRQSWEDSDDDDDPTGQRLRLAGYPLTLNLECCLSGTVCTGGRYWDWNQ